MFATATSLGIALMKRVIHYTSSILMVLVILVVSDYDITVVLKSSNVLEICYFFDYLVIRCYGLEEIGNYFYKTYFVFFYDHLLSSLLFLKCNLVIIKDCFI